IFTDLLFKNLCDVGPSIDKKSNWSILIYIIGIFSNLRAIQSVGVVS
ncbi:unnamed protein product, partial [marine sediment metagenome]